MSAIDSVTAAAVQEVSTVSNIKLYSVDCKLLRIFTAFLLTKSSLAYICIEFSNIHCIRKTLFKCS